MQYGKNVAKICSILLDIWIWLTRYIITFVNEEIGEILSYSSGFPPVGNILAGFPLVDVLLWMELHSVEREVLVLQSGDEFFAQSIMIQRHHAKFVR